MGIQELVTRSPTTLPGGRRDAGLDHLAALLPDHAATPKDCSQTRPENQRKQTGERNSSSRPFGR